MQNGNGKRKYVIDIDGTICTQEFDYYYANPKQAVIDKINRLYDDGNQIVMFTARGYETGIDWSRVTVSQLERWGVKYHDLIFGKPSADMYIDDKACHISEFIRDDKIDYITLTEKSWGTEYLLDISPSYAMKRMCIDSGKNISLQYHKKKRETWHIVQGLGIVKLDDKIFEVSSGNTVVIPVGVIHQIKAITDLVVVESSTIELDDIVRIREDF